MRVSCWALLLMLLSWAPTSATEKGARVQHVALLSNGPADVVIPAVRGFLDGLTEAGYVDGPKFVLHRLHFSDVAQVRAALKPLTQGPLDVIVATSATEAAVAKELTARIPIVFAPARDPVELGFVQSLARPGGNLTGLSYSRGVDDNAKQLAVFKQMVPALRRVTVLYPRGQTTVAALDAIRQGAQRTKLQLTEVPVDSFADAERAVRGASRSATDGFFCVCSALFRGLGRLSAIAERESLPLFGCTASQVAEEGVLLTYTPDIYYIGYRGAWYVDRILKGARPQALPVEVPSRFELVVNLRTAQKLAIKIPPQMLILADKVFS